MEQTIFAVSQVNEYIKAMMDREPLLNELFIRGELSNYKVYPSGHHYFTLKDEAGALRCVIPGKARYVPLLCLHDGAVGWSGSHPLLRRRTGRRCA